MVMCLRMRSSALRVTVVALVLIAFAAAAAFLFNTERQIAASTAALRAFDRQARDASDAPGDVIFTEGAERAAAGARQIESARLAEHQDFDAFEAQLRRQQAMAAAGAGAFTIFAVLLLAPIRRQAPTADSEDARVDRADPSMLALNLPREERFSIPRSTSVGPVMRTAADLATEFGRVRDLQ